MKGRQHPQVLAQARALCPTRHPLSGGCLGAHCGGGHVYCLSHLLEAAQLARGESLSSVRAYAGIGEDGRSRGFAHVQFESVEGAAVAIGMSGQELSGRELFIDSARERAAGGRAGAGGASSKPCTMRIGSTTLVLAQRMLKYHTISVLWLDHTIT